MLALEFSGLNSSSSRVEVCVMVGYGPNEGDVEERRHGFWNDMDMILDGVGKEYRLCILGNLNGWIGYEKRAGITSAFGVPGE